MRVMLDQSRGLPLDVFLREKLPADEVDRRFKAAEAAAIAVAIDAVRRLHAGQVPPPLRA